MPTLTPSRDLSALRIDLQVAASGLHEPVDIANAADGTGRLFIVEKAGRIRVLQDGELSSVPFLDITGRVGSGGSEQGLLGLVFHPDYVHNGFFFVNYTDRQGDTVISRFVVGSDPEQADPSSEVVILTVAQPAANHNGGQLAFGPDGLLYAGLGDGGRAGDPFGNGQNTQTLLGKMLRLDVDHGQPYAVPASNPFAGSSGFRPEIWATGLRNPWRFSFDRSTGDLYIADVGQNEYEEIDYEPAGSQGGENYGWSTMEGMHCYPASEACDRAGLTLPVAEYDHSQGCSVTGGYVYRGQQFPSLDGIYLFSDYCSGRIWALARGEQGQWRMAEVGRANIEPSSFGEDESGELYLADLQGGQLYKIVALP
jgi:glucose/arabinose dehydrogenase